ncbi:Pycsar system effector family protein [Kitasatospora sp. NPDC127111]|uniref:Pycsar system effector family protein n=1 Tax=Kitasatospora sp. NPDC127111 TaxID=3345363 RepID=UPI00363EFE5F
MTPVGPGPDSSATARAGATRTAERLLADLRQETARADTKGSVLVGAQGMAAAAFVGVLTARGWDPADLAPTGRLLWWAGVGCFLGSMGALLMAVMPRYRTRVWRPGMPLTHFADIRSAAGQGTAALEQALHETDRAPLAAALSALAENSRIVAGKYRWLRTGMASFTAALVLLPAALLAG